MNQPNTSPKIKAIKAQIITTRDPVLVGKIIVKSANSLNASIDKCRKSVITVKNVARYIRANMQSDRFVEIEIHDANTDLDYARDVMVSAYEQVELISSAWAQFATLIAREQITSNFSAVQSKIGYIYHEVMNSPAIADTKDDLWNYYQVEDLDDRQRFGTYLLDSIYKTILKYETLIDLYSDLANDNLNSASYINSVFNVLQEDDLRQSMSGVRPRVPIQQQIRNRFRPSN